MTSNVIGEYYFDERTDLNAMFIILNPDGRNIAIIYYDEDCKHSRDKARADATLIVKALNDYKRQS